MQGTLRALKTAQALELAEWLLIEVDIGYCIRCIDVWRKIPKSEDGVSDNHVIATSLFRNAVVSFISCFDKSVTPNLDVETVYKGVNGASSYFAWLKDLRDSWIAHRFGASRQAIVGPMVEDNAGQFVGFGNLVQMYNTPNPKDGEQLIRFMQIAERHAKASVKRLEEELEEYAKNMPETALLRLPLAVTKAAGPNDLRMGRRKFRGTNPQRKPTSGADQ
jgi:hypothetical protein